MAKTKNPRSTAAKKPAASKMGTVAKVASVGASLLGIGGSSKGKGGKKGKKKSALWYAKEIQRVKLKKKYEKVKLGLYR